MNEKTFNKKKEELLANIDKAGTLGEKILAVDRFQYFMRTKSHNGHWNPKYRKNRVILLPNGTKIPWKLCNPIF